MIVVEPTGAETELLIQVGAAQVTLRTHGRPRGGARAEGRHSPSIPPTSTCSIRRPGSACPCSRDRRRTLAERMPGIWLPRNGSLSLLYNRG